MHKPLPPELIATRPAVALDPTTEHPSNGLPIGRPPAHYTKGVHQQIVTNIEAGNRPVVAAQMAGITSSTFYKWMQEGRKNDPHLWEFAQDVELAEGKAEGTAVSVIREAMKMDPENAKWWLERGRARGWNKAAAAMADAQIEEFMNRLEAGLSPEIFQLVLSVAVGQSGASNAMSGPVTVKQLTDGSGQETP